MSTLLTYHIAGTRENWIRLFCAGHKISIRSVLDSELHLPIGALAGRPSRLSKKSEGYFSDEMLVFVDFSEELLDSFLTAYRASGLAPIALKAVLTPHNQGWDSVELHRELTREREEFLRNRLKQGK